MSSLERVAEGVYRLGTEWVGWYLCQSDGQVTVVDCGFPDYFDQLPPALSQLGLSLDAVAAVVLTHYHGDHVGCAERIRPRRGRRSSRRRATRTASPARPTCRLRAARWEASGGRG